MNDNIEKPALTYAEYRRSIAKSSKTVLKDLDTVFPNLRTDYEQQQVEPYKERIRAELRKVLPIDGQVYALAYDSNRAGTERSIKMFVLVVTPQGPGMVDISGMVAELFGLQEKQYTAGSFRYKGSGQDMRYTVGYRLANELHGYWGALRVYAVPT